MGTCFFLSLHAAPLSNSEKRRKITQARTSEAGKEDRIALGSSLFNKPWIQGKASTTARDGLGPKFNANACVACHIAQGQGKHFTRLGKLHPSMVVRLSYLHVNYMQQQGGAKKNNARLFFGDQLNTFATKSVYYEGQARLQWQPLLRSQIRLYFPNISLQLAIPSAENIHPSIRIAPSLIGLGLLESIDLPKGHCRFGYKNHFCFLEHQVAHAAFEDMGLTSIFHPFESIKSTERIFEGEGESGEEESTQLQKAFDINLFRIRAMAEYVRSLPVPARMKAVSKSKRLDENAGFRLFSELKCIACHRAEYRTKKGYIYPFSDLSLHDMGDELASSKDKAGRQWRTAPLWDLAKRKFFLHDGRARTIEQAILWHGGEAMNTRKNYQRLTSQEQKSLVQFLRNMK